MPGALRFGAHAFAEVQDPHGGNQCSDGNHGTAAFCAQQCKLTRQGAHDENGSQYDVEDGGKHGVLAILSGAVAASRVGFACPLVPLFKELPDTFVHGG